MCKTLKQLNYGNGRINKMKIYSFLKAYIGPVYTGLASLCSIIGLMLMFISNTIACIIALTIFCVGFVVLIWGILRAINKVVLDNSDKEYKSISTTYVYHSKDGKKSTLDTYRMIQCKRLFLTEIHFNFKWTGTKMPKLSSDIQSIEKVRHNKDGNKWDDAVIKFNRPLRYNECTVMNIKSENDDIDNTAKPWLSCKLSAPIDMINYQIMLSYKKDGFNQPAFFERKKIDSDVDGDFEYIESVEFDEGNKIYRFCIVNPEPGYIYRLRWEK